MEIHIKNRDGVIVMKPIGKIIGPASAEFRRAIIDEIKGGVESPNFVFDFAERLPGRQRSGSACWSGLHVINLTTGRSGSV